MVEMTMTGTPALHSPKATVVHIEFENCLKFDREEMNVVYLIEFLTKIRGALCMFRLTEDLRF